MIDSIRTIFRRINTERGYGLVEYAFALGILIVVGLTAMGATGSMGRPAIEQQR